MSEQILRRTGRSIDSQAVLPWLMAASICFVLVMLSQKLLNDPDTYWQITVGRWILDHHAVPTIDTMSQTMRGKPWVAFEWLSQVGYATGYALGGWTAVAMLAATAAAAAFGLLARFLLREWAPTPAILAVLCALVLTAPHILARPHTLALPTMIAWIAALVRAVDTHRAPSWRLLPLMTLWANLHGSFIFGLAMIGPAACDALWNARISERRRVAQEWLLFAGMAVAAACLNPYGPEIFAAAFRVMSLGKALTTITEWHAVDFGHLGPYEIIVLSAFGLALYCGVKLPLLRMLMLLGVLYLSLAHARHADLLGLLAPVFLARPLAEQFVTIAVKRNDPPARMAIWPSLSAGLLAIVVIATAVLRQDVAPPAKNTPADALRSLDIAKAGPIFNDYNFGAYFDFVGVPPFIDGRTELYGAAYTLRFNRARNLEDVADFIRLLDQYRIKTTLLSPDTPAVTLLDRLPGWRRVYSDDVAVVHQRRTDPHPN